MKRAQRACQAQQALGAHLETSAPNIPEICRAVATATALPRIATAQAYPTRPITLIVPVTA
jgi:hypothetical protein